MNSDAEQYKYTSACINYESLALTKLCYLLGFVITGISLYLHYKVTQVEAPTHVGTLVIVQYFLLSACMITAWYFSPNTINVTNTFFFLFLAILCRLILILVEPYTSNDIDRYMFDGKIALEGLDPYRIAHNHPSLAELKAVWQPPVEHEKYVTVYPPGAIALFSFAASMGETYAHLTWKIFVSIASVITLILSHRVLLTCNQIKALPFIALSPILLIDIVEGAHLDAFVALSVISALFFWQKKNFWAVGVVIGMGALIKFLPLVMLAPLVFLTRSFRSITLMLFGTFSVLFLGYGLAYIFGWVPLGSLETFFIKWRSGSVIFTLLSSVLSSWGLTFTLAGLGLLGYLVIMYCALTAHTSSSKMDSRFVGLLQASFAIPLLLTPVIFPWYLAVISLLIAFRPSVFLILWTISLPLVYEVLNQFICCGHWFNAAWPITLSTIIFVLIVMIFLIPLTRNVFNRWQLNKPTQDKLWLI